MTKQSKRPVREGVSYLIESELERAALVLAATEITDSLQGMAENLAKVEAEDIMPMLDQLRDAFGAPASERFNQVATAKVRATIEAIKQAKEAIGGEISRLKGGMDGGPVPTDMEMDGAGGGMMPPADGAMPPVDGDVDPAAEIDPDMDPEMGEEGEDDLDPKDIDDAVDAAFADDDISTAAGRAKKESAYRVGNRLAESTDPDTLILMTFRDALAEGVSATIAARGTARSFGIDVGDVVWIVKEAAARGAKAKAKVRENQMVTPQRRAELQKMGYGVAKTNNNKFFWSQSQKNGQQAKPNDPAGRQQGVGNDENQAWADLDAHVGASVKPGVGGKPMMGGRPMMGEGEKGVNPFAKKDDKKSDEKKGDGPKKGVNPFADKDDKKSDKKDGDKKDGDKKGDGKKPDADKDGVPNWADKKPFKKGDAKEDRKVDEAKDDPCWDDHEQVGMKKKNGKSVPNCVPKK